MERAPIGIAKHNFIDKTQNTQLENRIHTRCLQDNDTYSNILLNVKLVVVFFSHTQPQNEISHFNDFLNCN